MRFGDSASSKQEMQGKTPWHLLLLSAVLALSAFLNLSRLRSEGYANLYYAAAVKNMLTSWHNFFFASYDAGFVSVDKPPLGFWMQATSAYLFGFHGWSLLLPQALAGILSVALLYYLLSRSFGPVYANSLCERASPSATLSHLTPRHDNTLARIGMLRDEVGRLLVKWHTQVMNLFRLGRFARVASLLPIVIVLCVGAFLCVFPTGLDVPAALTKAHSSPVSQGTNLESHPLEGSYLAAALGEAEEVDKHPVDADLLSALLLLAVSFGVTFVWLLTNGQGDGACRSLGIDPRRWFVSALEDRSFLEVFRL